MKKHWLRALLLGVSLALLLAGGVALAQGLTITVDQHCFECWPWPKGEEGTGMDIPDDYLLGLTITGGDGAYDWCEEFAVDGERVSLNCPDDPPDDPMWRWLWASCVDEQVYKFWGENPDWTDPDHIWEFAHGLWTYKGWQVDEGGVKTAGPVYGSFYFLGDCSVLEDEEFVPEPGTILLLGSGLAGLAGYATLRWRTRE